MVAEKNMVMNWLTRARFCVLFLMGFCWGEPIWAADRFVFSEDGGEVTDQRTGLIWQRCSVGMTWDGENCLGREQYYMWWEVLHVAVNQARTSGVPWRVPNVKEMASILDRGLVGQAVDVTAFPNTPNAQFWTSSPFTNDPFYAWAVDFYDGRVYYSYSEDLGSLRLVRDSMP